MALEAERQCRRRGSLLFTHSCRIRFAGRLNSGVMPTGARRDPSQSRRTLMLYLSCSLQPFNLTASSGINNFRRDYGSMHEGY